ncbi:MAG: RagB/SusD family nutrient uptake outer membrane protein [Bacteroidales bacterium]|nr:RagB/SusD family nutrient uptake outer membrane protein [Bacteroidales bacterium]
MKTLNKILLLIFVVSMMSCQKNLNFADYNKLPQPKFWKTAADAQAAITSCYGSFVSDWAYYDPNVLGPEEMASDETAKGSTANSQADLNAFIDYSFTPSFARFANLWKSRYSTINLCNQVITNVPNINMNQADKDQIIGEAKFMRAWDYFELVKLFGAVPIYNGLPQSGAYDIPSSPIDSVYSFILKDLDWGYAHMRKTVWDNANKGRATAWAARALEAKVLMYMASGANFMPNKQPIDGKTWADVEQVTNDVINNGPYKLYTAKGDSSYFYLFRLQNENCSESIFEIQAGASWTVGSVNGCAYALNQWIKGQDGGFGYSVPSDTLVAAWKARYKSQHDLRYKASVIWRGDTTVDGMVVQGAPQLDGITGTPRYDYDVYVPHDQRSGIKGGYWMQQIEQNFRLFRYADVLLIDAEAKFMNGDIAGALISINKVRERAGEPDLTAANLTLQKIWDERRFELAFSNDRYFDLIRTGQAQKVLGYRGWQYPKNVFYPIPQTQIDLSNGQLKQNPNW